MRAITASDPRSTAPAAVGIAAQDRRVRTTLAGMLAGQPTLCVRAGGSARAPVADGGADDLLVLHGSKDAMTFRSSGSWGTTQETSRSMPTRGSVDTSRGSIRATIPRPPTRPDRACASSAAEGEPVHAGGCINRHSGRSELSNRASAPAPVNGEPQCRHRNRNQDRGERAEPQQFEPDGVHGSGADKQMP